MVKLLNDKRAWTVEIIIGVAVIIILSVFIIVLLCEPKYTSLEITTPPTKTQYIDGEPLDTTGLTVKAYYGNDGIAVDTYSIDKTIVKFGDDKVTVSYTDGGITKSATFDITVAQRTVQSIDIISLPHKTKYIEGDIFNVSGLVVQANYNNGDSVIVSDYEYDLKQPLKATDEKVHITYGGQSANVNISVEPKILSKILASRLPQKVAYTAGEYFDFYGLEVYALYENAEAEIIKGWDYDKKERLQTADSNVEISYTLNDITKSFVITITVSEKTEEDADRVRIDGLIDTLPSLEKLDVEHKSSIEYVLSVLNNATDLSSEQLEYRQKLQDKYREITDAMPEIPEPEYDITYEISDELVFSDINYGNNPEIYKNSYGAIELTDAQSDIAYELGYEFVGWFVDGKPITHLENISADITVYASFVMTATANLTFKEYVGGEELLVLNNVSRVKEYDFDENGVTSQIYSNKQLLPIAYYSQDKIRLETADLSQGRTVIVYVAAAQARELHLANDDSASVGWVYDFNIGSDISRAEKSQSMGTVFVVPVGSTVTIMSIHANIGDILLDGVSSGIKVNNSTVKAEFELSSGEFAVSVTFKEILTDMTTVSFIGYNSHSVIYPASWDGYIAEVDLNTIAFIYDENNEHYLVTYTINGTTYYFEDLAGHRFESDTQVWVERKRNIFSVTIVYTNGKETIDGLIGKQALSSALNGFDEDALEILNSILADDRLYKDAALTVRITASELLSDLLKDNIVLYSPWEQKTDTPPLPDYGEAEYEGCDFVNMWTSQFIYNGDILNSELNILHDGTYSYKTKINGVTSVDISGIYRLEDGALVVKTAVTDREYGLITVEDIKIDITFIDDGLMIASFLDLRGTDKNVFDHTLVCGEVKIVNYTDKEFLGMYEYGDVIIALRENGTAIVYQGDDEYFTYYRVTDSNELYIFINGVLSTGVINNLLGETQNES